MSNYGLSEKKCVGQTFGKTGIYGKRQFDLDIKFFKIFLYESKIDGAIFILSKFGAKTMIFTLLLSNLL